MDVGQIQFLLRRSLRIPLKIKCATIVHAAAVALRSEALPGAQDREQLAHFEFPFSLENFNSCGTAFHNAVKLHDEMNPAG